MNRVVVTGGSGKAGRAVVAELGEHGFEVLNADVVASLHPDDPTLVVDLTDLAQAIETLRGADAVVHLAAIPAPNVVSPGETFRINMMSTYNVFSAAELLGLDRVVWASSETLIGIPFDREQPRYAPIDENHPRLPESHYALAKLAGEVVAEQFNRWSQIPFVSLRISNIMEISDYTDRFPGFWDDPKLRSWNLWGYVDARDVAQAVRRALTADITGSEAFLVAAADTCMTTESAALLEQVFPKVPVSGDISGYTTLLSIDKARTMLGYEPQHSWRDYISD